jgi:hypothetical protein
VLPLPEALGLRWWQHIIVTHEHCVAAEVADPRKATLKAHIQLRASNLIIPLKLCRRRFPIKMAPDTIIDMA